MLLLVCLLMVMSVVPVNSITSVQNPDPGRQTFEVRCARCHGADGNGGEMGPPIASRLAARDDQQLASLIRDGLPAQGMPPSRIADPEVADLLKFLRTVQRRVEATPVVRKTFQLQTTQGQTGKAGKVLDGQVLGEGFDDVGRGSAAGDSGRCWRDHVRSRPQ